MRLSGSGVPENGLELIVRGGRPRSSRLELSGDEMATQGEWFGSDRERPGTGRESLGAEVNGLGVGARPGRTEVE